MNPSDITRLRELAGKATPGKRGWSKYGLAAFTESKLTHVYVLRAVYEYDSGADIECSPEDGDFVEVCDPHTIISLCERVEKLEGALRESRHKLEYLCKGVSSVTSDNVRDVLIPRIDAILMEDQ